MPEWRAFGWFTASDRVEWDIEGIKKGKFDVYLEWSVSDEEAGKPFILVLGNQQLKGIVGKTGSWENFKEEKIGTVQIAGNARKVVFKPGTAFENGALLDLREIRLVPTR